MNKEELVKSLISCSTHNILDGIDTVKLTEKQFPSEYLIQVEYKGRVISKYVTESSPKHLWGVILADLVNAGIAKQYEISKELDGK